MIPNNYRPKIIVTKIGLDGHDRGSRIVAAKLRDSGMEVVYTPPWQSISEVVRLAEEEDADVVGISSLATDHLLIPELLAELREANMDHVGIVVGGIIPDNDEKELLSAGVDRIFHPGSSLEEIAVYIESLANRARVSSLSKWEAENNE